MLFYKPLVSLVTAMALASTVTASATPVRRNPTPEEQCTANAQHLYCCTGGAGSLNTFGELGTAIHALLGINLDAFVALQCTLSGLAFCAQGTAVCCTNNNQTQYGLINIQTGCIIVAL
ncbi:hypothetical protein EDB89DRAFT_1976012 [Lactarius sanguifluus]|nr:hypothetical protein EDB89DRAFT_1976012 [Lactarius sanguifluus]